MRIIEKAVSKAIELHAGQFRKGDTATPYITHPIEVAMIVSRNTDSEAAITAALLHDTVEDCDYTLEQIRDEFGSETSFYVGLLSEDKSQPDPAYRKLLSLEVLKHSLKEGYQLPVFIKAADALSNMRSLKNALDERGPVIWRNFNFSKADKLAYYRDILRLAREVIPVAVIEEYASLLKELELAPDVRSE